MTGPHVEREISNIDSHKENKHFVKSEVTLLNPKVLLEVETIPSRLPLWPQMFLLPNGEAGSFCLSHRVYGTLVPENPVRQEI